MTDAGWAEKKMKPYIWWRSGGLQGSPYLSRADAIKLLTAEHARSVRIVKAEINAVKRDRHNYSVTTRVEMVKRLEGLLAKLECGRRGGKG